MHMHLEWEMCLCHKQTLRFRVLWRVVCLLGYVSQECECAMQPCAVGVSKGIAGKSTQFQHAFVLAYV